MKRKIILTIIVLMGAACQISSAQALSVEDCVDMALRENKDIKSAFWKADQYWHTSEALKANYFPRVTLKMTDIWETLNGKLDVDIANPLGSYITSRFTQLVPRVATSEIGSWYFSTVAERLQAINPVLDYSVGNVFSTSIQVEQPIYMGGKIKAGHQMGQLGYRMASLAVNISEDEVIVNTYEAYSLVVKAREMTTVAQIYDSLLVSVQDMVESAIRNGMASHADLMKVQAERSKSELQLHQAKNGYKLAKMNLCHIIGLPLDTDIELKPLEIGQLNDEEKYEADVTNRVEYTVLELQTELARKQIDLERADFMPQVGLAVSGGYIDGIKVMNQNFFDDKFHAMVAVEVKIPIFHAGEGRHKVAAAKAEYHQKLLEQQSLNEMMALEIQQSINELDEARLEVELCERVLAEANESLRLSRKTYENGMETITDLLQAQTEWQNEYATLVDARHRYALKEISWKKAAGLLNK